MEIKKYLAVAGLCLLLGCEKKIVQREYTAPQMERGVVVSKSYTPSRVGTDASLRMVRVSPGFGVGLNGGFGPCVGPMVVTSERIPERYDIHIRCQHGTCDYEGSEPKYKKMYDDYREGQEVEMNYHEVYDATYIQTHKKAEKDLVERTFKGYEHWDVAPKSK